MVNYGAKILFVLILLRERDQFHITFVTVYIYSTVCAVYN